MIPYNHQEEKGLLQGLIVDDPLQSVGREWSLTRPIMSGSLQGLIVDDPLQSVGRERSLTRTNRG